MATIRKRVRNKGTVYTAVVRIQGHPETCATFNRQTDAKRWASQTETDIKNNCYFPKNESNKRTLADAITRYKAEILHTKKQGTVTQQEAQLDWWMEELGKYSMANLTAPKIIEARSKLMTEKNLSPATSNRYTAVLSHVFTVAMKQWQWVNDSPFRLIERNKESRGRVRYLDPKTELPALRKACRESPCADLGDVVELALGTGCRKNEILTLRWKDVDLERGLIFLQETKNGERRGVSLSGNALAVMQKRKSKRNRIDTDYIFPQVTQAKPIDIDRPFVAALAAAKIEGFCFHDLRHTFASYLAMSGGTLPEIAAALGHKTYTMVQRYAHLGDAHTSKVISKMDSQFLQG